MEFLKSLPSRQHTGALDGSQEYHVTLSPNRTALPGLVIFGHAFGQKAELPLIAHRHKDKYEFVILLQGIFSHSVSNVNYTAYVGDCFITKPNEEHHSIGWQGPPGEFLWFQIDASCDGFLGLNEADAALFQNCIDRISARQLSLSESLQKGFLTSFHLLSHLRDEERLKGRLLFLYCFMELLETKGEMQFLSPDIDQAKQYILLHIKEAIDIDELLLESGLSLSQFRHKFEKQIGLTPRDYINQQKIHHSKKEVLETRRPITDIAYIYHFSSVNFYKLLFKRIVGLSPAQYRKKHQKMNKIQEKAVFR